MIRLASASVLLVLAATGTGQAQGDPYPWCADYSGSGMGGAKNCYFMTLEQCRATVFGVGGYCTPNPFYTGVPVERPAPRRARPR
jgi:hypothetical protein